ncbi:MAG: hypothetical protein U0836_28065, partial [Pirellulales bacterium]
YPVYFMRPEFRLRHLFLFVGVLSACLAFGRWSYLAIEDNYLRTHPDEAAVARQIQRLGGAYHVDKSNGRHITGVWLDETPTTDDDLRAVLTLPELKDLHVSKTRITDESLPAIFAHKRLRTIRVRGSLVTWAALRNAIDHNEQISVDE